MCLYSSINIGTKHTDMYKIHTNTNEYKQYKQYNGVETFGCSCLPIQTNTCKYIQNTSEYAQNTYWNVHNLGCDDLRFQPRSWVDFVFVCIACIWLVFITLYKAIHANSSWVGWVCIQYDYKQSNQYIPICINGNRCKQTNNTWNPDNTKHSQSIQSIQMIWNSLFNCQSILTCIHSNEYNQYA